MITSSSLCRLKEARSIAAENALKSGEQMNKDPDIYILPCNSYTLAYLSLHAGVFRIPPVQKTAGEAKNTTESKTKSP